MSNERSVLQVQCYCLGPLQTNSYMVRDTNLRRAVLVDAVADDPDLFSEWDEGWRLEAILQTHAHFDHIGGLAAIVQRYRCPVYIHRDENGWLFDPEKNGAAWMGDDFALPAAEADHLLQGGERLRLLEREWQVLHTPGHSPGGLSFWLPEAKVVFSGDALFAGGIGRTDLPGGNERILMKSLHEKLMRLPDDTRVLPGHGPVSDIAKEKRSNPFLRISCS